MSVAKLATLQGMGWGSGLPMKQDGSVDPLLLNQARKAASLQGVKQQLPVNDDGWLKQYRGPIWHRDHGIPVTADNWRRLSNEESQRLYTLGFTNAVSPPVYSRIYREFGSAVPNGGATDSSVFIHNAGDPSRSIIQDRAVERTQWSYVLDGSITGAGNAVRNASEALADGVSSAGKIAKNVTNPLSLASLAVLAVVGVGFIVYNKVT